MKGSPIIATLIVIVVLLGLYTVTRTIVLGDADKAQAAHAGHDHSGHDHAAHGSTGHDDSSVETQFEIIFSSKPKSLKITNPVTKQEIFNTSEIDSVEWLGEAAISLEGHVVELLVDVEWENPGAMNMAVITLSPAQHASREVTLRSEDNISDIAKFNW
ncbi:hypothetical protein SAMN02745181_2176 [Rubritalea squalenifaciens DSM 18772]|uniref:Uncharacterized protein n=1 Tax=Rubritalea squalenifaciens DSM 18772 TaxID=1123071 RepID=A0A1M6KQD9_9BACT|nr:hypothetical protein [Rubritalea squalenifaciens]SHJ61147.1 hypothetical protein SAMN02745181_2176 [Rubritalea squalenifaciens DSM 18772]